MDLSALRQQAGGDALPPLLRGLVKGPSTPPVNRPGGQASRLRQRLVAMPPPERHRELLRMVCGHVAAVLGHPSAAAIEPERAFRELGLDSLSAVELRNRISDAVGLRLPATLAFDHPAPTALAEHVAALLRPDAGAASSVMALVEQMELAFAAMDPDDADVRTRAANRLRTLASALSGRREPVDDVPADGIPVGRRLESATPHEIFDFIDSELGLSPMTPTFQSTVRGGPDGRPAETP
jgi:acyl carrier protein